MSAPKNTFKIPTPVKYLMMFVSAFLISLAIIRSNIIHQQWPDAKISRPAAAREPMPELQLIDQEGHSSLLSEHFGTTLIVSFWASWCHPCLVELPEFARLKNQHKDKLKIIAINQDDEGDLRKFLDEFWPKHKIPFKTYFDPGHKLAKTVKLEVLPTNIIVDKKGRIVFTTTGYVDWHDQEATDFLTRIINE